MTVFIPPALGPGSPVELAGHGRSHGQPEESDESEKLWLRNAERGGIGGAALGATAACPWSHCCNPACGTRRAGIEEMPWVLQRACHARASSVLGASRVIKADDDSSHSSSRHSPPLATTPSFDGVPVRKRGVFVLLLSSSPLLLLVSSRVERTRGHKMHRSAPASRATHRRPDRTGPDRMGA